MKLKMGVYLDGIFIDRHKRECPVTMILDTGNFITPGLSNKSILDNYRVYRIPEGEEWRLPLIESLLEVKAGNWDIEFDEEEPTLNMDAVKLMLDQACSD